MNPFLKTFGEDWFWARSVLRYTQLAFLECKQWVDEIATTQASSSQTDGLEWKSRNCTHTERPDVRLESVWNICKELWTHVVWGTNHLQITHHLSDLLDGTIKNSHLGGILLLLFKKKRSIMLMLAGKLKHAKCNERSCWSWWLCRLQLCWLIKWVTYRGS
jgi:hypothetical protein